jgi:hypothetical protein
MDRRFSTQRAKSKRLRCVCRVVFDIPNSGLGTVLSCDARRAVWCHPPSRLSDGDVFRGAIFVARTVFGGRLAV